MITLHGFSLLSSMFLSTPLGLLRTQLAKEIKSPAEGEVVALVAVEFVEDFKFRVGDDEV